jgi:hypothetical protein
MKKRIDDASSLPFFWRGTDRGLAASGTYPVINAPSHQHLFSLSGEMRLCQT